MNRWDVSVTQSFRTFINMSIPVFHWAGHFSGRQRGGRTLGSLQRAMTKEKGVRQIFQFALWPKIVCNPLHTERCWNPSLKKWTKLISSSENPREVFLFSVCCIMLPCVQCTQCSQKNQIKSTSASVWVCPRCDRTLSNSYLITTSFNALFPPLIKHKTEVLVTLIKANE